jgi:hypothetical protein
MPPVTKAGGSAFRKDVEFVAKYEDERVAYGVVMVPDKADLQNDFAREETIRSFTDQFETFAEAGQAGGGIMHAVWPDGWMDLERNEVLDEAEDLGGRTVDAGVWVQGWSINHDDLWTLIQDDVLSGYSIGAIQVDWDGPFEQDEVDDVDTSEVPDDELVWELTDGIIREVSAVDIPAVPDAEILEAAKDYRKRLSDHVGNQDAFIEEAMDRGHSEAEAIQLWGLLTEAIEEDGAGEPGKQSRLQQAGKAFLDTLTPGSTSGTDDDHTATRSEAPDTQAETPDEDPRRSSQTVDGESEPLALLADQYDVAVDDLEKALVRVADIDAAELDAAGDSNDNHAPEGGTSGTESTAMNERDSDGEGGDKPLAEQNAEQINELTQAVEDLTECITGPEAKTAEIEIDGEAYDVREDAAKAALGIDGETDVGEAIARLNEKAERVDEVEDRLDSIVQQSGRSQQLEQSSGGGETKQSGLDGLGEALS